MVCVKEFFDDVKSWEKVVADINLNIAVRLI